MKASAKDQQKIFIYKLIHHTLVKNYIIYIKLNFPRGAILKVWDYMLEVRHNEWFLKKVFDPTQKTNSTQTNQPNSKKLIQPTNPKLVALLAVLRGFALSGQSYVKIAVFLCRISP